MDEWLACVWVHSYHSYSTGPTRQTARVTVIVLCATPRRYRQLVRGAEGSLRISLGGAQMVVVVMMVPVEGDFGTDSGSSGDAWRWWLWYRVVIVVVVGIEFCGTTYTY